MFTFSLQTSDNQTPRGAASLMKTQELLSRPAVSLCQKYASFIQTSKRICTKKRRQIICSKHTIRQYFSISFWWGERILVKTSKFPSSFFFKGGISKYNPLFEDISDQHIEEDIYNMIRGYIVITTMIVFSSHMQIKECWRWLWYGTKLFLCITTKHESLPAY